MFKPLKALLVAGLVLAPACAFAVPIRIDFTITSISAFDGVSNFNATTYNGYNVGDTGGGHFVFDTDVGNFTDLDVGLIPTELTFDWAGVSFDQTIAQIWSLQFDSAGNLFGWNLGVPSIDGSCRLNCLSSIGPADFFAAGYAPYEPYNIAVVHAAGLNGWMNGSLTWTAGPVPDPVGVPEPGMLGLLGAGLLGVAIARRRRAA